MSIELINADIVAAHLLAIPEKVRGAVEKKAVREASQLIVGKFRENSPVDSGALRRSLKSDVRQYRGGKIIVGLIGADDDYVGSVIRNKSGKRVFKKSKTVTGSSVRRPAKYLHLVNLGTQDRNTKAGENRAYVGKHFDGMKFKEKTQEQIAGQVQQILADAVQEALR